MTSYLFFKPSMILSPAYRISFHLCRALNIFIRKIMIVIRIIIFSKRNTCTFTVGNFAVLNNPSLTPMRTNHAILISCRRSPGSSRFCNAKTTDCDISYTGFGWHKAFTTHINFHIFLIWIFAMEISINYRLIFFLILLCIPFISRFFRNPATLINRTFDALFHASCFIKSTIIEIYASCMFISFCKIPVSINHSCIWIIATKKTIRYMAYPYIFFIRNPCLDTFCSSDNCPERLLTSISNSGLLCTGMNRIYIFPVNSRSYENFIPRLCNFRCIIDMAKRHLLRTITVMTSFSIYINLHVKTLPCISLNLSHCLLLSTIEIGSILNSIKLDSIDFTDNFKSHFSIIQYIFNPIFYNIL